MNQTSSLSSSLQHIHLPTTLQWSLGPVNVLVDSGVDDNFVDSALVEDMQIHFETLDFHKTRQLLATVTHHTQPLNLVISSNHCERVQLFVIPSPTSPVVLCLPGLKLHNPYIETLPPSLERFLQFPLPALQPCLQDICNNPSLTTRSVPGAARLP